MVAENLPIRVRDQLESALYAASLRSPRLHAPNSSEAKSKKDWVHVTCQDVFSVRMCLKRLGWDKKNPDWSSRYVWTKDLRRKFITVSRASFLQN